MSNWIKRRAQPQVIKRSNNEDILADTLPYGLGTRLQSKDKSKKKYIIGNAIDPIVKSNDFLFDVFMEGEFKKSLNTLGIYSFDELQSIALVGHECSTCYSMTSLNYLFMQYSDSAKVYLFKYDYQSSSWVLKRDSSKAGIWSIKVDSIIKNREDEVSVLSNNNYADLVRYG